MKKTILYLVSIILLVSLISCKKNGKKIKIKAYKIYKERAYYSSFDKEAVQFKGALRLTSKEDLFGGLSALFVSSDKKVIALSDIGLWVRFKLNETTNGHLESIQSSYLYPLIGENEYPLKGEQSDAEGITRLLDGRFAVSFEKSQRILIYDLKNNNFKRTPQTGPKPLGLEHLVENATLESLFTMENGSLVAISEAARTPSESLPVWYFPDLNSINEQSKIRIRNQKGYSLTGADRYQDIVFVLFRIYFRDLGYKTIIKALPAAGFEPNNPYTLSLNGIEVITIRLGSLSENLEGISIIPEKNGMLSLYLVSDNNFSPRLENILVKFQINATKVRQALEFSIEDEIKEID